MLELLPQGCTFGSGAAEMSFDISTMVGDWEGESLVCVLRKESAEGGDWSVLEPQEALTIAEYDGESKLSSLHLGCDRPCRLCIITIVAGIFGRTQSCEQAARGRRSGCDRSATS